MRKLIAITMIVAMMLGLNLSAAMAQAGEDCDTFDETGHSLCGAFQDYWDANGGLPVFGYPLSDEFDGARFAEGTTYATQYFERERFEYHPDNANTQYEVLLGRLGVEALQTQGRDWNTFPKADPGAQHFTPATGQAIAPEFWDYWSSHGLDLGDPGISFRESLALFGFPISGAQTETNAAGDTVLTQWFERARFENHDGSVLLGLLGSETLDIPGADDPIIAAQLAQLRQALGRYLDVDNALADGFAQLPIKGQVCFGDPEMGNMGVHYVMADRLGDGELHIIAPELLVYEPTADGMQLVAVEYFIPDTGQEKPSLYGRPIDGPNSQLLPEIPIHYSLHAWAWKFNPSGVFAPYNPDVQCPE